MRVPARSRKVIAVLALLAYVPACHSWRPIEVAPRQFMADSAPDWLRVTTRDGVRFELVKPEVRGDSLTGLRRIPPDARGRRERPETVALADISQVETRKPDGGTTVLAVVLVSAGLTVLAVIGCSTGGCGGLTR